MSESIFQVKHLTKSFGSFRVLTGVNFEIFSGEIVGLIGPNGAGKSTVFNLISGLIPIDEGIVTLFGQDITKSKPHVINQLGMARTFQSTRLFRELTVIENLMLTPKNQLGSSFFNSILKRSTVKQEEEELLTRAYETLELLEITHIANNRCSELSGGQSKLVDIARVLMNEPRILLLDEPVAGVAGPLVKKIFDKILTLRDTKDMTIIIIEHNMEFILKQGIDRVLVMGAGRIIADAPPDKIREMQEVIEVYLGE